MSNKQQQQKAATQTANTAARLNEALGGDANKTPDRDDSESGSADPGAGTVPAPGADEPFEVIAESKTHRVCQSATRAWKEPQPAKPERAA
jgi:hypothetical protein